MFRPGHGAEMAGYLLVHFDHPYISLGLVVRKGNVFSPHEEQRLVFVIDQSIQEVSLFALLDPSSLV